MPTTRANGIDLYYETFGEASNPPVLLICGLGMQMTTWGDDWFEALGEGGYYVIAFDNRDAGLSTHLVDKGVPNLMALLEGGDANIAYYLGDMAADTVGVLDAAGVESAHVLGISMGGMIAQQLAIDYPERVRSLTSIMSTTGDPTVGQPTAEAAEALLSLNATSREEAIELSVTVFGIIGSPGFPPDEARMKKMAAEAFDRCSEPTGVGRQMGAVIASPDRTPLLAELDVPTLVVHGMADPLVNPSGGEATAAAIPGARIVRVEGMGHDLPLQVWGSILEEVAATVKLGEDRLGARLPDHV